MDESQNNQPQNNPAEPTSVPASDAQPTQAEATAPAPEAPAATKQPTAQPAATERKASVSTAQPASVVKAAPAATSATASKTGDTNLTALWITLSAVSAGIVTAMVVAIKKRRAE